MNPEYLAILMLVTMIVFIMLGAHVALVLGGIAVIFGYVGWGTGIVSMFPDRIFSTCTSFSLEAVTLFILMGVVLEKSGIAERLYGAFHVLMGPIRGGLLLGTIMLAVLFAACTGISGAAVVAMGLIALPSMLNAGYEKTVASGVICAGGGLGVIIPPSIMLIVYGPTASLSVAQLFIAAILPGLLLGGLYTLYIGVLCFLKPKIGPPLPKSERAKITVRAKINLVLTSVVPILGLIFAVLGSIIFGLASPTEAASVGAIGSLVICASYRQLTWENLKTICLFTIRTSAFIMLIVVCAGLFTTVFLGLNGGKVIEKWIVGLQFGKFGIMMVLMGAIFFLGMFMDWLGLLLIFLPIVVPIITEIGINQLWFAILFCITLQMSYVTPPFSYSVFYLKGVSPQHVTLSDIYKGVMPYIPLQVLGFFLIYLFPDIVLWLPRVLE
jgi:tripartite ATP-independent transporter DctM subunit